MTNYVRETSEDRRQAIITTARKAVGADARDVCLVWRVGRLDREGDYYHLVLVERQEGDGFAVVVEHRPGRVGGFARMTLRLPFAVSPIAISEQEARQLATLGSLSQANGAELAAHAAAGSDSSAGNGNSRHAATDLVWMPSKESPSPFFPLWRVRCGTECRFVDQRGNVLLDVIHIGLST